MKKLLVRIDQKNLSAVSKLEEYGNVEKVSILLNLFSVEGSCLTISKIRRIDGVISVEEDYAGELLEAL